MSKRMDKQRYGISYLFRKGNVRERDKYRCRVCGKYEDLQVHHIVPVSVDISQVDDESNMITLCAKCHRLADEGEIKAKALKALINLKEVQEVRAR